MIIAWLQSLKRTKKAEDMLEDINLKPSYNPDPKRPRQYKLALDPILNTTIILLFAASLIALSGAYISEYIFGLKPCILCLYQRKPFFAILALTLLSMVFFKGGEVKKVVIFICALLLLLNTAIAIYHVGVEKKIVQGPTTCASETLDNINDLEALKKALAQTKAVRCDKPSFIFLGISMAGWNALYCLGLLSFIISTYRKSRKPVIS